MSSQTASERSYRWQLEQRAEGLCMKCSAPAVNAQHCEKHRLIHNLLQRRAYQRRKAVLA